MKSPSEKSANAISNTIADFAIRNDSIPADAARIARIALCDWLAVSVAGRDEPVSRIMRAHVLAEGGAGEAAIIGAKTRVPARAAALANGTISHALDYDDTHFAYLGHPGVVVFPAALAMAAKTGARGNDFLNAAIIGMESATRIGAWLGREHHLRGFHSTATIGIFGATLAASRLLGLSIEQTLHALGLSATRASGLRAHFGTMGKPYHAGMAASGGVECALLASAGFIANPGALESELGFATTHGGKSGTNESVFKGLGQSWIFRDVLHKFHACCHAMHASLEALIAAKSELNGGADAIRAIKIKVPPRYLEVCNILEPETGLEAKFSFRLCAAMILAGRDTAALSAYSDAACRDAELLTLRDKVEVIGDENLTETQSAVRIETADGGNLDASHDIARPMPPELREEKIRAKVSSLLGENAATGLWELTENPDPASLENWLACYPAA